MKRLSLLLALATVSILGLSTRSADAAVTGTGTYTFANGLITFDVSVQVVNPSNGAQEGKVVVTNHDLKRVAVLSYAIDVWYVGDGNKHSTGPHGATLNPLPMPGSTATRKFQGRNIRMVNIRLLSLTWK